MASTKYLIYSTHDGDYLGKFTSKDEVIELLESLAGVRVFKKEPSIIQVRCACGEPAVPGLALCQTCLDMKSEYGDEGGEE